MEKFKKLILKFLFPSSICIVLVSTISFTFMLFCMLYFGLTHIITIITYPFSMYSLILISMKFPYIIKYIKLFRNIKIVQKYYNDHRFRINVSLYSSLLMNVSYGVLQLFLGIYYKTFIYYSIFIYYVILALIRYYLVIFTKKYSTDENIKLELKRYRFCGYILLLINISLSIIIFMNIYSSKKIIHHPIVVIAMAAYTFTTFTFAIINLIKYRKYKSPVYMASKIIALIATGVSMFLLECTMLTTFGNSNDYNLNTVIKIITGGVMSILIIFISIYMIIVSNRKMKYL